ncbi:MAG: ArnT family glycosyltransferase [Thermoanaerobaculum sp.]
MSAPKIATVLALATLLAVAAWAPLVDRDEPRYAQAVREMHQSGDLLVPKNFGQLRPDKPILVYWLQWAGTALLGERELGFRLPSFLALLAWLWLAAHLAQELCGEKRWALLPGMAMAGALATPDALVGALTTACLLAFLRAAKRRQRRWALFAWLLFGLGAFGQRTGDAVVCAARFSRLLRQGQRPLAGGGAVVGAVAFGRRGGRLVSAGQPRHPRGACPAGPGQTRGAKGAGASGKPRRAWTPGRSFGPTFLCGKPGRFRLPAAV